MQHGSTDEGDIHEALAASEAMDELDAASSSGSEDECLIYRPPSALAAPRDSSGLPSYFQAFAECLQEWEAEFTASTDEHISEMAGEVDNVQRLLEQHEDSGWAQGAEALQEEDRQELQAVAEQVLKQRRNEEPTEAEGLAGGPEMEESAPEPYSSLRDTEAGLEAGTTPIDAIPTEHADAPAEQEAEQEGASPIEAVLESETPATQVEDLERVEQQEATLAEEVAVTDDIWADAHQLSVQELEEQQRATAHRLQEEMRAREEEQTRAREEMHMLTEDMRLREFYSTERSFLLHNRRCMVEEDFRCQRLRQAARQKAEAAERSREEEEQHRMSQEDRVAAALRDQERQQRESMHMQAEDTASKVVQAALRLQREHARMVAADKESQLAEQAFQEAWEMQRMKLEDEQSGKFFSSRKSCPPVQRRRQVLPLSLRVGPSTTPEGILAALLKAPMEESSSSSTTSPRKSGLPPIPSSSRPTSSALARQPLETRTSEAQVLDPFTAIDAPPSQPRSSPRAESSHGAPPRLCGSVLCKAVVEGHAALQPLPDIGHSPSELANELENPQTAPLASAEDDGGDVSHHEEDVEQDASWIRVDHRMEDLTRLPALRGMSSMRILILTSNKLRDVSALQSCTHLEELSLCTNLLSSLKGLAPLKRLSVLKATQNSLTDVSDLSELPSLRHVELSVNKLSSVQLHAKWLVKLVVSCNGLASLDFLRHLPSLTHLDAGRNQIEAVDAAISQWSPLLVTLFLEGNKIRKLPELNLPLLSSLSVVSNRLEELGPLGFLPSLELLRAAHNNIARLGNPLACAPILQRLGLEHNCLAANEVTAALQQHVWLTTVQLTDNPFVEDMMEAYRPWVLRLAPQLKDLDSEAVTAEERDSGTRAQAGRSASFAHGLALLPHPLIQQEASSSTSSTSKLQVVSAAQVKDLRFASRRSHWLAASAGDRFDQACQGCLWAPWCRALASSRSALISSDNRRERAMASYGSTSDFAMVAFLRQRTGFWTTLVEMCREHYAALMQGPQGGSVAMLLEGNPDLSSRLRRLQAHWRRRLAQRRRQHAWLEAQWEAVPHALKGRLLRAQARWRGYATRRMLRSIGVKVLADRRGHVRVEAAVRLQAAVRGSRARQRLKASLKWARQMSELVDHNLTDCPEVDVGDLLGDLSAIDNLANPFTHLAVPDAHNQPVQKGLPAGHGVVAATAVAPMPVAAWETPPRTAESKASEAASSPGSLQGALLPRTKSLSSTAESAVLESSGGLRGLHQVESLQRQHPDEENGMAKAYLASQKKRRHAPPRPPPLQGSQSQVLAARNSGARARNNGALASKSLEPNGRKDAGGPLKAQDAIAEYRRQQQQDEERQRASSEATLEFQSGTPNLRLMRSSKGMQPNLGSSPRASSPKLSFGM